MMKMLKAKITNLPTSFKVKAAVNFPSYGTYDYEELEKLPKINNVELKGNKSLSELGIINYDDTNVRNLIANLSATKVDKISGMGLSTNDYTTQEKTKLASLSNYDDTALTSRIIAVEDDIDELETGLSSKLNKDNIIAGDNITLNKNGNNITINSTGGGSGGTSDYTDLTNKPKINNVELSGNKTLNDLGINNFSGNYNDLTNKPIIPTVPTNISSFTNDANYINQVKTINNQTITGTGNIEITGGSPTDNESITLNSDNEIQTVGVIDSKTGNTNKQWTGTTAEYNALAEKDNNTIYFITDDETGEYATKSYVDEKIGEIETALSEV